MVGTPTGIVTTIVCGSRTWDDCKTIAHRLEELREQFPLLTVIDGRQRGADSCAGFWSDRRREKGVHAIHISARWHEYPEHMKWRAEHDRNKVMLDALLAARDGHNHGVCVVAFKETVDPALFAQNDKARSKGGTEHMIGLAWAADVPVWHTRGMTAPRLLPPPARLF